jgi:RNA polymerase sigma-70 factor (ECF subfamily)
VASDLDDFEAMFRARYGAVLAYALRRADGDDARDVVADTFLVAWRRFSDRPTDAELPWLYGIARRTLANQRRAARRRAALTERLGEASGVRTQGDGALADALGMLGERDREALLLVAWEGLKAEEGARVVGCRTATFRMRVHRARMRLAALLDQPAAVTAPSPWMQESG